MYSYKIENINFCDGTSVQPGSLTLIVGPNNSGKSRILRDILSLTTGGRQAHPVVNNLAFTTPNTARELFQAYKFTTHVDEHRNVYLRSLAANLNDLSNVHVGGENWTERLDQILSGTLDEASKATFGQWFGNSFVSMFSTEERLKIVRETETAERGATSSLLHALYEEGATTEDSIRKIVKLAFQKDIRLDYSTLRKILFRIGDDLSMVPKDTRDAMCFYEDRKVERLDDQGDGIRSFVATAVTMMVGDRPVLLMDEPEAFLHPPQAFRLGEVVAELSHAQRQVFVATHSSEFLRGVLSKRQDVSILRIERRGIASTIRTIDSAGIAVLANDPLLSSTRILDGLFYQGAIVVEADADSVFYQRVSRELSDADNFHLVHAHNKQTVAKVLPPYRSLGIRHAAIVDFDVMRVTNEFAAILKGFDVPLDCQAPILSLREKLVTHIEKLSEEELLQRVINELEAELARLKTDSKQTKDKLSDLLGNLKRIRESGSSWKEYKKLGRAALDSSHQEIFDQLVQKCAQQGLFIVPVGELEGWLVSHGVAHTSNKSKWIVKALEKLPSLDFDASADPWRFMQSVFTYLNSPQSSP